ncbi:hypothetical protein IscW_ISCW014419, partial [Ixodes scapularis]
LRMQPSQFQNFRTRANPDDSGRYDALPTLEHRPPHHREPGTSDKQEQLHCRVPPLHLHSPSLSRKVVPRSISPSFLHCPFQKKSTDHCPHSSSHTATDPT